jgi:hypothetical protein
VDPEEELIGQIGLLLTQLRYSRRALEDIERSTALYGSFAFTSALSAGPQFGEPPLQNGALKVYVTNINDLRPGGGLGGFFEGLLGGIGRLFGGLVGGVVGGTVSGILLPWMIYEAARLTASIDSIAKRFGFGEQGEKESKEEGEDTDKGGATFLSTLAMLKDLADALTALFTAASQGPDKAGDVATKAATSLGERWMGILTSVQGVLRSLGHLVYGLTLLIPLVVAALATLLARLDAMKLAIVELLQFGLRNLFLLRGVAMTTLFDTLATAARLAAEVLRILGNAVTRILASVFNILGELLQAVQQIIEFVAGALERTIGGLLRWLADTLTKALTIVGNSRVFRVIVHIIQQLPAILPPLILLVRDKRLKKSEREALEEAAKRADELDAQLARPGAGLRPQDITPPTVSGIFAPSSAVAGLAKMARGAGEKINKEVENIFDTSSGALESLGTKMTTAADQAETKFYEGLSGRITTIRNDSENLANTLTASQRILAERKPPEDVRKIYEAFSGWLAGGGLDRIISLLTRSFASPEQAGSTRRLFDVGPVERPRATIEIRDVVIDLQPAPGPPAEPAPEVRTVAVESQGGAPLDELLIALQEFERRGLQLGAGAAFTQVHFG